MNGKLKSKYLVIGMCAIFVLVLGTTLAWYTWISENTDVTFTIGGITITYEAGEDITDVSLRPVSTKELGVENNYAIKKDITVSSNKSTYLNLYLNAEIFEEGLKHETLKWEVYEGNSMLNSGNFGNTTQGDTITLIENLSITSTERILTLYIWIDGNMSNPSSMQNQQYRFVLNAEATDQMSSGSGSSGGSGGAGGNSGIDRSGANVPRLLDGMVAVRYKKCSEIDSVSEETYPACYKTKLEINNTDRQDILYRMCEGDSECMTDSEPIIDTIIETGEYSSDSMNMTLEQLLSQYESLGGVLTSEPELIYHDEYESGELVVASATNWYNYDEKKWANAVLVNDSVLVDAPEGTVIAHDKILAHYVWIPRYKYKLFNASKTIGVDSYNAETTGVDIVFENGTSTTGTVRCSISSAGVETCENATNGTYYTHPAFTFGDKELKGIWVGKFEISSSNPAAEDGGGKNTDLSIRIIPNVVSWRSNTVSNYFTLIQNMTLTNNEYGLNNSEADSHMMKNMEWGAVTYLTNSKYGRCTNNTCVDVKINGTAYNAGGNNYAKNVEQSSTGNIYGIYDLNGGSLEYVMGNILNENGEFDSSYAEFTIAPLSKYYDVYTYGETYDDQEAYSRGHLGDATGEVVINYVENEIIRGKAWYSDSASLSIPPHSWIVRGGESLFASLGDDKSGPFYFDGGLGNASSYSSTRAVLVDIS